MLRRSYVGNESNCSGGKEKERRWREMRAVESARKRLCVACVPFFLLFSFYFKKKIKNIEWASPGRCPGKPGGRIAPGKKSGLLRKMRDIKASLYELTCLIN
jgi:hypothetical protein